MGERPRKVIYAESLWDWIDQKMTKAGIRDEEAQTLKEAGTLLALQEAAYKRALHEMMDELLNEDDGYVVDLDKQKEEEEVWEEEFNINNPSFNRQMEEDGESDEEL